MADVIEIPARMRGLPFDKHGRLVPWFVAFIDGAPDHRIALGDRFAEALRFKLCWVCGQRLGSFLSFVIGPMCSVNRVTTEPPCHKDCAVYSARVCPFLTTPRMRRRDSGKPAEAANPGGTMITRNPGVTLVWTTRSYRLESDGEGGRLLRIGASTETLWFAEGRPATRTEVLESIESGLPILRASAEQDGPAALAELESLTAAAMRLVPVAAGPETEKAGPND
jgi:hypothetical protein